MISTNVVKRLCFTANNLLIFNFLILLEGKYVKKGQIFDGQLLVPKHVFDCSLVMFSDDSWIFHASHSRWMDLWGEILEPWGSPTVLTYLLHGTLLSNVSRNNQTNRQTNRLANKRTIRQTTQPNKPTQLLLISHLRNNCLLVGEWYVFHLYPLFCRRISKMFIRLWIIFQINLYQDIEVLINKWIKS